MLCTAVILLLAILAFCGFGPKPSVWGRVSFGLGFLLIASGGWSAGASDDRTMEEKFAHIAEAADAKANTGRYQRQRFSEYRNKPPLEFWDADRTLPKTPKVGVLYGPYGHHKTNVVPTKLMDAVIERGARVVYAAGEGAYGVGKNRVPAHCEARGIEVESLDGRFEMVPAVPPFGC
jgi:hypothetical protein